MPHATHVRHADVLNSDSTPSAPKLTRSERARKAIGARLEVEDWDAMTAAANASSNHVSSLDRWRKIAAARNPHLSPKQLDRQAERLRSEFFRTAARKRWAARTAEATA